MAGMTLERKLAILSDAAKYDASCASSGTEKRDSRAGGIGSTEGSGICHAYTPDGRCISLLKILMTNFCIFDCAYCVNRVSSNVERARFTAREVVDLTVYRFVQESILNALKHGKARQVDVAIALRPGDASCDAVLEAIVANDGTMPIASNREGYGLIGIAERVEALGGFATAPAVAGGRTICRIAIPVRAGSTSGSSGGELGAALGAAVGQHPATGLRGHARTEAVAALADELARLIGALHGSRLRQAGARSGGRRLPAPMSPRASSWNGVQTRSGARTGRRIATGRLMRGGVRKVNAN